MDVQVDRNSDMLKQMIRKYKHPDFDITKPLNVQFVDEIGVDAGGVTREFFHLLMERVQGACTGGISLFEGRTGHLLPIHDYDLLSGGLFLLVGKIIIHAVLNNCTGVSGLSPAVASYLISGKRDAALEHITTEDIPDPVLQEKLEEVGYS